MKIFFKKFIFLLIIPAFFLSVVLQLQAHKTVKVFYPIRSREQLVLDAGHGGEDGGAVSLTGVSESEINLAITLKIDQILGFYGVTPILLRDADISLHNSEAKTLREKKVSDLKNRVQMIESTPNSVLISVHQNTFTNQSYQGAQVFYKNTPNSIVLAEQIQNTLREGADPDNRRTPAKISDTIYLMQHISCTAVLVECGFLSNPNEEELLRTNRYQTKIAMCIATGWLRNQEIQSGNQETPVV